MIEIAFKVLTKLAKVIMPIKHYYWRKKALFHLGAYDQEPFVGGSCVFSKQTTIGKGCSFNGMEAGGQGKITIGDYFHSGPGCVIMTSNHNYKGDKIPYDNTFITRDVHIGNYVWLGRDVTILPGVTIGEGAIIQAGSVVVKDIPALSVAGGHPATVFTTRDKKHYEDLKKKGQFHGSPLHD